MNVKSVPHLVKLGRILSCENRVKLLAELAHTPMPKKKIKEFLGLSSSGSVTEMVEDMMNAGLCEEYLYLDGGVYPTRMVRMVDTSIVIELKAVKETGINE